MPLATVHWKDEVEYVHQLRVATRRADAALLLFTEMLPAKRSQKMRKLLKRVRRSAGDARDLDVLLARLQQEVERGRRPLKKTIATITQMRRGAQRPIEKMSRTLAKRQFSHEVEKLTNRVHWRGTNPEVSYEQAARSMLSRIVDEFFAAAAADLAQTENLHALRIEGKQLRYAIEIFAGAHAALRENLYPQVEQIQSRLGELNDHATAEQNFLRWQKFATDAADEFNALREDERRALRRCKAEFRDWWTPSRANAMRESFRRTLGSREK